MVDGQLLPHAGRKKEQRENIAWRKKREREKSGVPIVPFSPFKPSKVIIRAQKKERID